MTSIQACIRHLVGDGNGREAIVLPGMPLTVGRDGTCGLCLEGATISRVHARFSLDADGLQVECLSQGNPLWLNGSRSSGGRLRLWDLVVIGPHVLRIERLGSDASVPSQQRIGGDASLLSSLLAVQGLLVGDDENMVQRALDALLPALPASRLALFEIDSEGQPSQAATAVRDLADPLMSAGFARQVLTAGVPMLLDQQAVDQRADWNKTLRDQAVCSILGVPVRSNDRITAVLLCDNREQPGQLDGTHLRVLVSLGQTMEQVLQRDQLRRLTADRLRSESEIAAARQVQEFLTAFADGPSWRGRWAVVYTPALDLAGDVHAVHEADGVTSWLVADVSGKGLPAALVAAMLKVSAMRRLREGAGPAELLRGLHQDLCGAMPPTMFFTACAVRLAADGTFSASGIGHPPILVVRTDGRVESIPAVPGMLGLPLASEMAGCIGASTGRIAPGDRIALITDGATEAMNASDDMLGDSGVAKALAAVAGADAATMVAALERAVIAHRNGAPPSDDLTLVVGGL